jgi:circadian clock protein KaiB
MAKYHFKLYIVGQTLRSRNAIANIQHICRHQLEGDYHLAIIDILEQPQMAEENKILATPTLVKEQPPPMRRIIGDLSEAKEVLIGLGLQAQHVRASTHHKSPETETDGEENGGIEHE